MDEKYWIKRQNQKILDVLDKAYVSIDYIGDLYFKSTVHLNSKILQIFDRYKKTHGILSDKEAENLLNKMIDKNSYDEMLKLLRTNPSSQEKQDLLKDLDAPAYRYRIERLQKMNDEIDMIMQNIYNQEKEVSSLSYIESAHDSYYQNVYNFQNYVGYELNFDRLDPSLVEKMLKSKWSGENFSARIWANTNMIADELKKEMMMGVLTGKSEKEMANTISREFNVGAYKARRLVETETAAIVNEIDQMNYEQFGIKKEKFVAVHDFKTSEICQKMDGTLIEVGKGKRGINIPPMHPHCRSDTIPIFDDDIMDSFVKREKDSITGEERVVKVNETYDQWYKRMQKEHGIDTVDTFQKKVKNRHVDRKQYYKYKGVLGNEFIPDSLDKFQEMKYNDINRWKDIKDKYRIVNQYEKNSPLKMKASKIYKLDSKAVNAKRNYFTGKLKTKGNIGIMEFDGNIFYSHSKLKNEESFAYKNFKGDKLKLVLERKNKEFRTLVISDVDRKVDAEAKLFEYAAILSKDGKQHEMYILSELASCDSCINVMEQFITKYPNVKVHMVSTKKERMDSMKGKVWKHR